MRGLGLLLTLCLLSACGMTNLDAESQTPSGADSLLNEAPEPAPRPVDEHSWGNAYYTIHTAATGKAIVAQNGAYRASGSGSPAVFYFKPAAPATYIFYDQDSQFLKVNAWGMVARNKCLDESVQWVAAKTPGGYTLKSLTAAKYLSADATGALRLKDAPDTGSVFIFQIAQGKNPFPEADINVDLLDQAGRPVSPLKAMARPIPGQPIIGWADQHLHAQAHLIAGGLFTAKEPFNPLGITKALSDCSAKHGPNGMLDIGALIMNGAYSPHATDGWPTFTAWPNAATTTHQQMYYKWLERAWLSGQRLLLDCAVNLEGLGRAVNILSPGANYTVNDMQVAELQLKNDYAMQDYIDAQCGGPGHGWFRICRTAAEARNVISQGKMAVFLGIEVDTVCDAKRDYIADYDNGLLTRSELDAELDAIRAQLDKFQALGVRSIFPIHGLNNGFGGCGISDENNLNQFLTRGSFFQTENADNPRITFRPTAIPVNDYTADLFRNLGIQLPFVPTGTTGQVNKRGLSKLGAWFIGELVARGMIIEMDHMSWHTKQAVLDMLWRDKYPGLTCSHGGIMDVHPEGTTENCFTDIPQMIRILQLGGLIAQFPAALTREEPEGVPPYLRNVPAQAACYLDYLKFMKQISVSGKPGWAVLNKPEYFTFGGPYQVPTTWYDTNNDPSDDLVAGLTIGTDANIMSLGTAPKTSDNVPLNYDDGSFGALHSGLYAGKVKTVRFLRQVTGQRTFDFNTDGTAHYGMLPDFIKHSQVQHNPLDLEPLFLGAEAYIRMIERVDRYVASGGINGTYPSRDPQYWVHVINLER